MSKQQEIDYRGFEISHEPMCDVYNIRRLRDGYGELNGAWIGYTLAYQRSDISISGWESVCFKDEATCKTLIDFWCELEARLDAKCAAVEIKSSVGEGDVLR